MLRRLRLPHIRRAAPEVIATARAQRWEPAEVLKILFREELAGRERSSLATRRAAAAFPPARLRGVGAGRLIHPRSDAVRTPAWVRRRENLVVCGPSGTGKTMFLEALGQLAVERA